MAKLSPQMMALYNHITENGPISVTVWGGVPNAGMPHGFGYQTLKALVNRGMVTVRKTAAFEYTYSLTTMKQRGEDK